MCKPVLSALRELNNGVAKQATAGLKLHLPVTEPSDWVPIQGRKWGDDGAES
jgi:hypothetical protein